jgi:DNA-binding SARP family transcriptional activator
MIRISLFGQLQINPGERDVVRFPPSKEHHLLSYLLLNRERPHSRSVLAGLFWGDNPEAQARKCLRTSLWRLRRALEADSGSRGTYLLAQRDQVCFNTRSPYWLDVEEFERCVGSVRPTIQGLDDRGVKLLTRAVKLYCADLLEGCYEDWCLLERDRLRELLLQALRMLADHYMTTHAHEKAIYVGQRILRHDPLFEPGHRVLMFSYWLAGDRGAALRQYQFCRDILAQELGLGPAAETVALVEQIRSGRTVDAGARRTGQPTASDWLVSNTENTGDVSDALTSWSTAVERTSSDLHVIQAELRHLRSRLQQSIAALEHVKQELKEAGTHPDRSVA